MVLSGACSNAFCIVRPPGHHAEPSKSMGFCIYSNVAVAAKAALQHREKCRKVAIIDWDVHHGNGTQECVEDDEQILYVSIHRWEEGKFFPYTGSADAVGSAGQCLNIPLNGKKWNNAECDLLMQEIAFPAVAAFQPDLILISAGFDACERDPVGGCSLTADIFAKWSQQLLRIQPRLVVALEGGYQLSALQACAISLCEVLLTGKFTPLDEEDEGAAEPVIDTGRVEAVRQRVRQATKKYAPWMQASLNSL